MDIDETPYAFLMSPSSVAVKEAIIEDLNGSYGGLLGHGCYAMAVQTKEGTVAKYTVDSASALWAHHIKNSTNRHLPRIYGISSQPVFEVQGFPVWRIDMELLERREYGQAKNTALHLSWLVGQSLKAAGLSEEQIGATCEPARSIIGKHMTEEFSWVVEALYAFLLQTPNACLDLNTDNWMWRPYSSRPVMLDPVFGNVYHAHTPVNEMKMLGDLLGSPVWRVDTQNCRT